jgi:8-oxo-dGTP pyrophosphatase MutT (NUDIX family)
MLKSQEVTMTDSVDLNATPSFQPQASAVPYRIGESGLEFCLITTRRSGRWSFPKGCLCDDQTVESAALNEALEEAGVTGVIVGEPLGQYSYSKRGESYSVDVLLMEVVHTSQLWKEGAQRQRCWVSYQFAMEMLDRPNLVQLLQVAMKRLAVAAAEPANNTRMRA